MKFKVDGMPYTPDECPFCETTYLGNCECRLDGNMCEYFRGKERDPLNCRHLIDDEATEMLANQKGEEK